MDAPQGFSVAASDASNKDAGKPSRSSSSLPRCPTSPAAATDPKSHARHLIAKSGKRSRRKSPLLSAKIAKAKRATREFVSKELGHEVDSDEERQYWEARSKASEKKCVAEEARWAALTPEEQRQERVSHGTEYLRNHIKPILVLSMCKTKLYLDRYPEFVLQMAPGSINGATCQGVDCTRRILPGCYRIALTPGMRYSIGPGKNTLSRIAYHIRD